MSFADLNILEQSSINPLFATTEVLFQNGRRLGQNPKTYPRTEQNKIKRGK
jgi:hypothetical protein